MLALSDNLSLHEELIQAGVIPALIKCLSCGNEELEACAVASLAGLALLSPQVCIPEIAAARPVRQLLKMWRDGHVAGQIAASVVLGIAADSQ